METGNIHVQSNLYVLKHGLTCRDDRTFLQQIVDPDGIRIMKTNNVEITNLQMDIYNKMGIHCSYCKPGDYPWGMVRYYDKVTGKSWKKVVCECSETQCKEYASCMKWKRLPEEEKKDTIVEQNKSEYVWSFTFNQYMDMSSKEKMKQLLSYWGLEEGPVMSFSVYNEEFDAYCYSIKGKQLRNPFNGDRLKINARMFKNQKYFAFDVNNECMDVDDLLTMEYIANKDNCIDAARDILHKKGMTVAGILNEGVMVTGAKNKRLTASMIKQLHQNPKTKNQCRHAGCLEKATNGGYCYEHFMYHMAESK